MSNDKQNIEKYSPGSQIFRQSVLPNLQTFFFEPVLIHKMFAARKKSMSFECLID